MDRSQYYSLSLTLGAATVVCLAWVFVRTVVHPLNRFPGPRLARWTTMYRMYWDVVKDGLWVDHLEELHRRYGPIVRVAPNELHFSDPKAYAEIYSAGSKFTKDPFLYTSFRNDLSVFSMTDPHGAAIRKTILSPFFSRRAILQLEPVIQEKVDKLLSLLLHNHHPGRSAVDLAMAFRSTTLDIITSYCFANCFNALDAPDFQHYILVGMDASTHMTWISKHFPIIRYFLTRVPEWLMLKLSPHIRALIDQRNQLGAQIDEILSNPHILDNAEHQTVYHAYFGDRKALMAEKVSFPPVTKEWLLHEGLNLRFAGSDTVGNTCTLGTRCILADQGILDRLVAELKDASPDKDRHMGLEALENLPYLTAVIKESLRLSHGTVTPLPRMTGNAAVTIAGTEVPPQTSVSIGATFVHLSPDIFPDPKKFSPDRWLQPDSRNLEKYLVAFSKGPRSCIGITLAWSELYLIFGNVFRRLAFLPEEFDGDDISFRDFFTPMYRGSPLKAHVIEKA